MGRMDIVSVGPAVVVILEAFLVGITWRAIFVIVAIMIGVTAGWLSGAKLGAEFGDFSILGG